MCPDPGQSPHGSGLALVRELLGRPVDEALGRYVDLLTSAGVERGLLGPREADRVWQRHIVNCAVLERLIPVDGRVADVGSGAGLPGLVLALVRPDLQVTLIEPLLRRSQYLVEVVSELRLTDRVEICRARAEDHLGEPFPVVTARAVAPLDRLVQVTRPLLGRRGRLLAMKGRQADAEIERHRRSLERQGAVIELITLDVAPAAEPTRVVQVSFPTA